MLPDEPNPQLPRVATGLVPTPLDKVVHMRYSSDTNCKSRCHCRRVSDSIRILSEDLYSIIGTNQTEVRWKMIAKEGNKIQATGPATHGPVK